MIKSDRNTHIMEELQEHVFCFIKVDQFIIAHMLQVQLLNLVMIVNIIQHELQECL